MYRFSVAVENADFKNVTIKVEESSSPVCTLALLPRSGKRPVPNPMEVKEASAMSLQNRYVYKVKTDEKYNRGYSK